MRERRIAVLTPVYGRTWWQRATRSPMVMLSIGIAAGIIIDRLM